LSKANFKTGGLFMSMTNPNNQGTITTQAMRNVRIGTLLTFVGINLRFITGNVINALIFFNILQSRNPDNRYDMHTPSMPDMSGDVLTAVVFIAAYLFNTSAQIKTIITDKEVNLDNLGVTKHLKESIEWSKRFFSITIITFGLYFFSQYFLSVGLGAISLEIHTGISTALSTLNALIMVCSPLIFVYVYCQYLRTSKPITLTLYLFFLIRNLFATNVLGLSTEYDVHIGAPFLDILSPIIIFYSVSCIIGRLKAKPPLNSLQTT
jgi:hypothetical protein